MPPPNVAMKQANSITPCKRKVKAEREDLNSHGAARTGSGESSPKKARIDDVPKAPPAAPPLSHAQASAAMPNSPNSILKRVMSSSRSYLAETGGKKEEEATLPSPPAGIAVAAAAASVPVPAAAAAAASSASTTNKEEHSEEEEDRKMPAIMDPLTRTRRTSEPSQNRRSFSQRHSVSSVTDTLGESNPNDLIGQEPLADVDAVDGVFRRAAAGTAVVWLILVLGTYVTYFLCESNHDSLLEDPELNYDDTVERRVPQTAFFILLVSTLVQVTPVALFRLKGLNSSATSTSISGTLISAMVILSISMTTNALLGWGPRAVVIDPVTGSRVFLLRWVEWIPLSGFMTLLAESADVPTHENAWREPIIYALCQSLSTLCGMIFPYCQSTTQWTIVMIISCVLFVMIFPRVKIRGDLLKNCPKGNTVLEREYYDRRRFAYYLIVMCSIVWSVLVTLYFVNMVIHMVAPPNHWLRFQSLAMSCDTIADVIAKVVYTRIIVDAHQAVFASDLRTIRQLNELKQLMGMLWVSSSDVIVISTKQTKHRNATMLSPSFLQLVGANLPLRTSKNPQDTDQEDTDTTQTLTEDSKLSAALVLETDRGKIKSAYYIDTCVDGNPYPGRSEQERIFLAHEDLQDNAVIQALRITNTAWTTRTHASGEQDHPCEPLRALSVAHCDPNRTGKVMCEMKVSRHSEQTAVAVVRDVTERYKRFEAESRAHAETIARQRDMHTANRFTRHEVKNGLLSGIELCRTLGQSLSELKNMLGDDGEITEAGIHKVKATLQQSSTHLKDKSLKPLVDLDGTLRGVLDTVLAEVMAREVVHEVYQPRLEELDVPAMLISNLGMSKDRIPVTIRGGSMPKLLLDAQLIGHIHRNAVSNACKYGKQGGLVQTFVEFDAEKKEFRMEVTNEPGAHHDTLLALGESASEFVFAQGVRLQPHMKGKTEKKLDSSGDGAWIMQKCAKTMHGACNILFLKNMTRFTMSCPAVPVTQCNAPNYKDFVVPENVWGIGIDDSKIQRKLLSRILSHAGVHPSRQLLLGETHDDVTEFESTLLNLMDEHPTMKFLVIVDEHLDYDNLSMSQQEGVHSGSLIMKQILEHIPKKHLARLLVLMRSANDSAVDISLYTQRTHGYFPKAIMQRDRTREILAPLWLSRFPEDAP